MVLTISVRSEAQSPGTIRLGILTALSGSAAFHGHQQILGLRLALQDIQRQRRSGEPRIELMVRDTRSDHNVAAVQTYELIAQERVVAIIGPLLSDSAPWAFQEAFHGNTPIITASATADGILEDYRPWAFRNASRPRRSWPSALPRWLRAHGIKRPMLWYDETVPATRERGILLWRQFEHLTGQPLFAWRKLYSAHPRYNLYNEENFKRLASQQPDGLILFTLPHVGAQIIRELRRRNFTMPIFGDASFSNSMLTDSGGQWVNGVTFATDYWAERPRQGLQQFRRRFRFFHPAHQFPAAAAVGAYETLLLLHSAMQAAGVHKQQPGEPQREALRQALQRMKSFQGIMGALSMGEDGEAQKEVMLLTVRSGIIEALTEPREVEK